MMLNTVVQYKSDFQVTAGLFPRGVHVWHVCSEKSQTMYIRLFCHICLSVRLHVLARKSLIRFPLHFILGIFTEICRYISMQWRTQEFFSRGGRVQQIQLKTEDRERGSGDGSPIVRGSGGSCNFVQEISFHIVNFS
jgi:hypothetical protein